MMRDFLKEREKIYNVNRFHTIYGGDYKKNQDPNPLSKIIFYVNTSRGHDRSTKILKLFLISFNKTLNTNSTKLGNEIHFVEIYVIFLNQFHAKNIVSSLSIGIK